MQIIKSITPRKAFKEYSEIKNNYLVMNCGAIEVTLKPRVIDNLDVPKNDVQNQEKQKEKEIYK